MKFKRTVALALATSMVASAIVGCGSSSDSASTAADDANSPVVLHWWGTSREDKGPTQVDLGDRIRIRLHEGKRGCTGKCICADTGEAGHLTCEGNQQEASGSECRVHEVLTEAAIELLYDDDSKDSTETWNPCRDIRRAVEREDETCNRSGPVLDGDRQLHALLIHKLGNYSSSDRQDTYECSVEAPLDDTVQGRRNQGDEDIAHDFRSRYVVTNMRI